MVGCLVAAGVRLVLVLRAAAGLLAAVVRGFEAAAFRAAGLRRAGLRAAAALRVTARRVEVARDRVDLAARVDPEVTLRASCWTCLLNPSRRFSALFRSACFAAWLTRVRMSLTVESNRRWPSLMDLSIWRRRSGGTRRCACARADLPALTARLRRDRDVVRFLAGITNLPRGSLNAAR